MRLGVIGTGHMAREMAAAADAVTGIKIASVLSREADKARQFAVSFAPGAVDFSEIEPFLDSIDAVYVATPPGAHMASVSAALEAGRPVLCEKPLTVSTRDTDQLVAQALSLIHI